MGTDVGVWFVAGGVASLSSPQSDPGRAEGRLSLCANKRSSRCQYLYTLSYSRGICCLLAFPCLSLHSELTTALPGICSPMAVATAAGVAMEAEAAIEVSDKGGDTLREHHL